MRFQSRMLIFMLPVLLLTAPALGHHLWVSVEDGSYTVNRGVISERTDAYDPACVKNVKAYAKDGRPLSVKRLNKAEEVVFQTDAPAALASVVSQWGDRVNTTRGKKLMSRAEAEKVGLTVISAFFSTQFAKTLFQSSDRNLEPLGLKFEIVPLDNPMAAGPDEAVSFALLLDGRPLGQAAIYTQDNREIKTDQNGVAHIAFEKKGVHLLYASHRCPAENDSKLDYLKFMTFLTFEVK